MKSNEIIHNEGKDEAFSSVREHLDTGYSNTQKLIQFQDIKASTLIGLNTLICGFVVLVCKWVITFEIEEKVLLIDTIQTYSLGWLVIVTGLIFALGSMFLCATSIYYCILAIAPRTPKTSNFMPYALFPFHDRDNEHHGNELVRHISCLIDRETPYAEFIFNEYRRQLVQVGGIVFQKIMSLKSAVRLQKWQMLFSGISIIILCCATVILALIATRA